MPRPQNKTALLKLSAENYAKLAAIADAPSEELLAPFPPGTLNRNIRDVLAHLHEWHLMFLRWHDEGMAGGKPAMPAPGYTWKTTPDLNKEINEKYADADPADIRQKFEASHYAVMKLIESYSDDELFEKKRYKWTGSTSLGAYLVSATSSHYDWALKLIRKCRKQRA